jgi:hypothetical protein
MQSDSFNNFIKLISDVPDEAVIKALDLKCKNIQNDLDDDHWGLSAEAYSILYFRLFVLAEKNGHPLQVYIHLPAYHIEFYRKTIIRLVKAEELRHCALERFGQTFAAIEHP